MCTTEVTKDWSKCCSHPVNLSDTSTCSTFKVQEESFSKANDYIIKLPKAITASGTPTTSRGMQAQSLETE